MTTTDGPVTRWLLKLLGGVPTVRIDVSPEAIHFESARRTVVVPAHSQGVRPLLLHEYPGSAVLSASAVPLFPAANDPESVAPDAAVYRYDLLVATCRTGVAAIMEAHRIKLRPHVVVAGAERLNGCLYGFQYELLRRAAYDAGARTVAFEDPKGRLPESFRLPQLDPRIAARRGA